MPQGSSRPARKPSARPKGKPRPGAGKPSRAATSGDARDPRGRAPRGGSSQPRPAAAAASEFDEDLLAEVLTEDILPPEVLMELEPFPARVRSYLSAAAVLLPDAPGEALRYAQEAKKMASRSAAVREAVGMTAYQAGEYELAGRELRAAGRISGRDDLLPLIADCERALGRPEKALELATREVALDRADRVELRIVAAGARMDLGQPDEAALMLQGQLLDSDEISQPSARLKYTYARALLAAGRLDEARAWFLRAAAADPEAETDAVEQALALGPDDAGGRQ